jgi:hypothetical protein
MVMLWPFSVVRYLTSEASIFRPQLLQISMGTRATPAFGYRGFAGALGSGLWAPES